MVDTKNLGRQIRSLREAFGETQLELAMALGYDSPSTISMYESGRRGRDSYDVISRIARHYRITEDTLFHKDYSTVNYLAMPIEEPQAVEEFFLETLPLQDLYRVSHTDANKAIYAKHTEAARRLIKTMQFREQEFQAFMKDYRSLPDWEMTKEIIANMLWWYMAWELFYRYPAITAGLRKIWAGQISKKEFFRDHYLLTGAGDGVFDSVNADKWTGLAASVRTREADKLLRLLYKAPGGAVLAEYYAALRIRTCLTADCHSNAMYAEAGVMMIRMLAQIGNPHAESYQKAADRLHRV